MVIVAPRSAKLVEAQGRAVHAAARLRLLLPRVPHDARAVGHRQPVLAGRARRTPSSASASGFAGTPASHSLTGSVPVRRAGMASATADLQRDLGGAIMQSILGALLTAGYAAAFANAHRGLAQRQQREHQRRSRSSRSRSRARRTPRSSTRSTRSRSSPPRRRRSSTAPTGPTSPGSSRSSSARRSCSSCSRSTTPRSSSSTGTTPRTPTTMRVAAVIAAPAGEPGSATPTSAHDGGRPTSRCSWSARSSALLVGFWAQTQSTVNVNLFRTLNDLSGNMVGLAKGVYALGSIWAVLAVAARAAGPAPVPGRACTPCSPAPARGASPLLLNEALGTHAISGLGVAVRIGDGPAYPVANVATITALAFGIAPFIVRPLRRIFAHRHPAGVRGGDVPRCRASPPTSSAACSSGFGVAALVRVLLGSPGGQPSVAEVRAALTDLGYDVASIAPATEHIQRASVMDVELADRRARPRRRVRPRPARRPHRGQGLAQGDVPRPRRAGVRQSRPAGRAHRVHADARRARRSCRPRELVRTGVGGADAAVLVTMPPRGTPIGIAPGRAGHRRRAARRVEAARRACTARGSRTATSTDCASSSTTTARSRSTTSARRTRAARSTGATATTPRCSCSPRSWWATNGRSRRWSRRSARSAPVRSSRWCSPRRSPPASPRASSTRARR